MQRVARNLVAVNEGKTKFLVSRLRLLAESARRSGSVY